MKKELKESLKALALDKEKSHVLVFNTQQFPIAYIEEVSAALWEEHFSVLCFYADGDVRTAVAAYEVPKERKRDVETKV